MPETPPLSKSRTLCCTIHVAGVDFTGGLFVCGLGWEGKRMPMYAYSLVPALELEIVEQRDSWPCLGGCRELTDNPADITIVLCNY